MDKSKRASETYAFSPEQQNLLDTIAEVAPSKIGHFKRAYERKSLRAAITAKCLECVSFETKEIRDCTSPACPCFEVRPYQKIRPHRNAEIPNTPRME